MTAETGSIIIDPSISLDLDEAGYETAKQSAQQFEEAVFTHPADVLTAIKIAHDSLVDPEQASTVERLGLSSRQREIANSIASLLHNTLDASYLDVDNQTYAVLSSNMDHQQLVLDAQNANRRRNINPIFARRRVGLSTLQLFAQRWGVSTELAGSTDTTPKDQPEVA